MNNGQTTQKGTPVAPKTPTAEPKKIDKASTVTWIGITATVFLILFAIAVGFMWINNLLHLMPISAF